MPAKKTLQDCIDIAIQRGGKCLSIEYIGHQHNLLWECSRGHTWPATYNNVSNKKSWCPQCNVNIGEELTRATLEYLFSTDFKKCRPDFLKGLELDGYNEDMEFAFEYQGIQHYHEDAFFHRTPTAFKEQQERDAKKAAGCKDMALVLLVVPYWEYDKGVELFIEFIVNRVKVLGYESCMINSVVDEVSITEICKKAYNHAPLWNARMQELVEAVEAKGYKMISTVYMGLRKYKYQVKCDKDHVYTTSGDNIKDSRGRNCSHQDCGGKPVINDAVIRAFADTRCYTYHDAYAGKRSDTLLNFKCILGHDVTMTWDNFKSYKSCHDCFGRVKKSISLQHVHAVATYLGGVCKTNEYTNKDTPIEFVCQEGHVFKLDTTYLIKGNWCEECKK